MIAQRLRSTNYIDRVDLEEIISAAVTVALFGGLFAASVTGSAVAALVGVGATGVVVLTVVGGLMMKMWRRDAPSSSVVRNSIGVEDVVEGVLFLSVGVGAGAAVVVPRLSGRYAAAGALGVLFLAAAVEAVIEDEQDGGDGSGVEMRVDFTSNMTCDDGSVSKKASEAHGAGRTVSDFVDIVDEMERKTRDRHSHGFPEDTIDFGAVMENIGVVRVTPLVDDASNGRVLASTGSDRSAAEIKFNETQQLVQSTLVHEFAHVFHDAYDYTADVSSPNIDSSDKEDVIVSEAEIAADDSRYVLRHRGDEAPSQRVAQLFDAVNAAWRRMQRAGHDQFDTAVSFDDAVIDGEYSAATAAETFAYLHTLMQPRMDHASGVVETHLIADVFRVHPELVAAYCDVFHPAREVEWVLSYLHQECDESPFDEPYINGALRVHADTSCTPAELDGFTAVDGGAVGGEIETPPVDAGHPF